MESLLEIQEKLLSDLRQELAEKESRIETLRADIGKLERFVNSLQNSKAKPIKEISAADCFGLVEEIIRESGKPVPFAKIWEEFLRRGLSVSGRDGRKTLNARLSYASKRNGRFKFVKDQGWIIPELTKRTE